MVLASGHLEGAVSTAYYAMLYAARAALSERDEYARTQGGTWHLFHERYVTTGAFDQQLHAMAQGAQRTREKGDYEAITAGSRRGGEGSSPAPRTTSPPSSSMLDT